MSPPTGIEPTPHAVIRIQGNITETMSSRSLMMMKVIIIVIIIIIIIIVVIIIEY